MVYLKTLNFTMKFASSIHKLAEMIVNLKLNFPVPICPYQVPKCPSPEMSGSRNVLISPEMSQSRNVQVPKCLEFGHYSFFS